MSVTRPERTWVGHERQAPRRPADPGGTRHLRRRLHAARHAARCRATQPVRPRAYHTDRHHRGAEGARRGRRADRPGRAEVRRADAGVLRRAGRRSTPSHREGPLRRRGRGGRRGDVALRGRGRLPAHRRRVRAIAARQRSVRADEARRAPSARDARRATSSSSGRSRSATWPATSPAPTRVVKPHAALAPDGRAADRDGRRRRQLRPVQRQDDRLVEHQHVQLHPVGVRRCCACRTIGSSSSPASSAAASAASTCSAKCFSIAGALTKATGRPVKFMEDRDRQPRRQRQRRARIASTTPSSRATRRRDASSACASTSSTTTAPTSCSGRATRNALSQPTGPYRIGIWSTAVQAVLTNKVQQGFFRGAGSDAGNFALERLVDAAAEELRIDRRRVAPAQPHPAGPVPVQDPDRQRLRHWRLPGACSTRRWRAADLDVLARRAGALRQEGRYIGIGLATCQQRTRTARPSVVLVPQAAVPGMSTPESVSVSIDAFGGVCVTLFSPVLGQLAGDGRRPAGRRGVRHRPGDVAIDYADSQAGAMSAGPGGCRADRDALRRGARRAAGRVKEKMFRIAAHLLEASPEDIELAEGSVRCGCAPERALTLGGHGAQGVPVQARPAGRRWRAGSTATFTYDHPYATQALRRPQGPRRLLPDRGARRHVPVVEVDPETGHVHFLEYLAVHDCGTVDESAAAGRPDPRRDRPGHRRGADGGVRLRRRRPARTSTFMEYLLPTAHDVPAIRCAPRDALAVHRARREGRRRRRADGRAGALATAVEDALRPFGVRVDELPMTPERIVIWIEQARQNQKT